MSLLSTFLIWNLKNLYYIDIDRVYVGIVKAVDNIGALQLPPSPRGPF